MALLAERPAGGVSRLRDRFRKDSPYTVEPPISIDLIGNRIAGCTAIPFSVNTDDRGSLTELLTTRVCLDEPIVHVYQVFAEPGSVRAWVYHSCQTDRLAFTSGEFRVVLLDIREDGPTHGSRVELLLGERCPVLLTIPAFVAHGVGNIGRSLASFLNFPTRVYDPNDPDKWRLPVDSPWIDGGW